MTTPAPAVRTMAPPDVFISYAREDHDTAHRVADALVAKGFTVWWDRDIPGGADFANVIEENLTGCRAAVVLWSPDSVRSGFVRDESSRALNAGKLLPVRIADVALPLGFGTLQTLDLLDWNGDADDPAFVAVTDALRPLFGRVADPAPRTAWWRPIVAMLRRHAVSVVLIVVVAGVGVWGMQAWRANEAQRRLQEGVNVQFASDPNLEAARNAYLSALQIDPRLGRAHYYLGHVYAQLRNPDNARVEFTAALRFGTDLDSSQRQVAQEQILALDTSREPSPFVPATVKTITPAPTPVEARPSPAPAHEAPPSRPAGPAQEPARVAGPDEKMVAQAERKLTVQAAGPDTTIVAQAQQRAPTSQASADIGAPGGGLATAGSRRQPPPADTVAALQASVTDLFAADRVTRVGAATALSVKPELVSDAAGMAIAHALRALREAPQAESTSAGVASTLVLLLGASPVTLQANREALDKLVVAAEALGGNTRDNAQRMKALIEASASARPLAYIQIASEAQRPLAGTLAKRLVTAGYDVPGIENVGTRAPTRSEIRVQGASDQGLSRWMGRTLREIGNADVKLATLRNARPRVDTYEIWLDRDLCVTPERQLPACRS